MAIRNTAWTKVKPGQIISFRYKGKFDKKSVKRTIILLNPDYRFKKVSTGRQKRFVVGLQIDTGTTRPLVSTRMESLMRELGGADLKEGAITIDVAGRDTTKPSRAETRNIYKRIDDFVRKNKNWRTYDRIKCLRNRVYLEVDSDLIPKDIMDEFVEKQASEMGVDKIQELLNED